MPRRNFIPLALLAVLAVLTVLFAALGASASPSAATLSVQNATAATFGSPTGSTSFTMYLIYTSTMGPGSATVSATRILDYVPPDRMAVYQARPRHLLAVLGPASIDCALSTYTAIVGGSTPWTNEGAYYQREETLAAYSTRVPQPVGETCQPAPSPLHGQVFETAVLRGGYLVELRTTVVIPPQPVNGGTQTVRGMEDEELVLLEINGTSTRSLG